MKDDPKIRSIHIKRMNDDRMFPRLEAWASKHGLQLATAARLMILDGLNFQETEEIRREVARKRRG